jgi:hypothetical protein
MEKRIHIDLTTPTPCTEAGVDLIFGVKYVILIKGYGGRILDTAHARKTHKR